MAALRTRLPTGSFREFNRAYGNGHPGTVYNDHVKAYFSASRWLVALLLLAGCAGELNTPGEALRILGGNPPDAHLGEHYSETLSVAGGLRPYTLEVTSGTLPPGLELEGANLSGVPTELGDFTFMVTVSDANLSSTVLEHRLRVIELPPPALLVDLPRTETRAPFTIRVSIENARDLLGLRSRLRWDPALFSYVEGSLNSTGGNYALFSETGEDWLQVDLAWLATTFSGERLIFSFQLTPLEPARPGLAVETEFALVSTSGSHFSTDVAGARVAASPAGLPAAQEEESGPGGLPEEQDPETPDGDTDGTGDDAENGNDDAGPAEEPDDAEEQDGS